MSATTLGQLFKNEDIRRHIPAPELVLPSCYMGVELEIEGMRHAMPLAKTTKGLYLDIPPGLYWEIKNDGSLRNNGREFTSLKLNGKDLLIAIRQLDLFLQSLDPPPTWSHATSLHIHMDVTDLSLGELAHLVGVYILVEELLFVVAGIQRRNNFYCMPYKDSEDLQSTLSDIVAASTRLGRATEIHRLINDFPKYSALNLGSISYFGSIEFRHHVGTFNYEEIVNWINILMCIKRCSIGKTADHLPEIFSASEPGKFLYEVFGTYADQFTKIPNYQHIMMDAVECLQFTLRCSVLDRSHADLLRDTMTSGPTPDSIVSDFSMAHLKYIIARSESLLNEGLLEEPPATEPPGIPEALFAQPVWANGEEALFRHRVEVRNLDRELRWTEDEPTPEPETAHDNEEEEDNF